ncbi:hypothetical protein [uncultured Photobacterium sp.]|uniref:hypothetical protein n=1 Tax=uncultured Photobacterium sp. TaxID=173973 RepID=UPI002617AD94|nr:hypothetical protein [uncultured Photobacterium sp.]
MITSNDFQIGGKFLKFKTDEYPMSKIKGARVKVNTFKDHVLKILIVGLLVSSIAWVICPDSIGQFAGLISLIVGMLAGLSIVRKYELQVDFQHSDETGLQWVTIAKSNHQIAKKVFEQQVVDIFKIIT